MRLADDQRAILDHLGAAGSEYPAPADTETGVEEEPGVFRPRLQRKKRAARLTQGGGKVRVTSNPEAVHGCTLIGEVKGTSRQGGLLGQSAAHENAMLGLKNRAAEMGADTVLMVTSTTTFSGSRQFGEAYSCSAAPPRQ